MNRLSLERRARIIGMIAEGNSLRSTSRMADVSIDTVTKLLVEVGAACSDYQDRVFHNLKLKRIQCDEIWSFVYVKKRTSRRRCWSTGTLATFGHGRPLTALLSWFRPGGLAPEMPTPQQSSSVTCRGALRIACNSRRMGTRRTWEP